VLIENVDKLKQRFIFLDLRYSINCNDGWFEILSDFLEKIEKELSKCTSFFVKSFNIFQIKEKFGGLRIGCSVHNPIIIKLVQDVENKSYITCEICGDTGKLRTDLNWIRTLCTKHYNEYKISDLEENKE
jgi:hypothetical protein